MLRNIVTQSVMRQTNTNIVKRKFVSTQQNGFQNKLTPSFLILTTVKVPVKIHPEVAKPAQTQRNISSAPSLEFVSIKTFNVMDTSTVSMEKMKNIFAANRNTLIMGSFETLLL